MDDQHLPPKPAKDDGPDATLPEHRVVNSEALLQGAKELWIRHHGELYRLRETRAGGLILGK
jgi:hemin uptake protein HemP